MTGVNNCCVPSHRRTKDVQPGYLVEATDGGTCSRRGAEQFSHWSGTGRQAMSASSMPRSDKNYSNRPISTKPSTRLLPIDGRGLGRHRASDERAETFGGAGFLRDRRRNGVAAGRRNPLAAARSPLDASKASPAASRSMTASRAGSRSIIEGTDRRASSGMTKDPGIHLWSENDALV